MDPKSLLSRAVATVLLPSIMGLPAFLGSVLSPTPASAASGDFSAILGMLNSGVQTAMQGMNQFNQMQGPQNAAMSEAAIKKQIEDCTKKRVGTELFNQVLSGAEKIYKNRQNRRNKSKSDDDEDKCTMPSIKFSEQECTDFQDGEIKKADVQDEIEKIEASVKKGKAWITAVDSCDSPDAKGLKDKYKVQEANLACAQQVLNSISSGSMQCSGNDPNALGCMYQQAQQTFQNIDAVHGAAIRINQDINEQLFGDKTNEDGDGGLVGAERRLKDYLDKSADEKRNPEARLSEFKELEAQQQVIEDKLATRSATEVYSCLNDARQPFRVYNRQARQQTRLFCRQQAQANAANAKDRSKQVEIPCGLLDYLKQGAANKALSGNNTVATANDQQKAAKAVSAIDVVFGRIVQQTTGTSNTGEAANMQAKQSGGQASSEVLTASAKTLPEIEKEVDSAMPPDMSEDLKVLLKNGVRACFSVGRNFERNQRLSPGSEYAKEKRQWNVQKRNFLSVMKNEVTDARRNFQDAIAAVKVPESVFTTKTCDENDGMGMISCYKSIRENLFAVHEGTGGMKVNLEVGRAKTASTAPVGQTVTGKFKPWAPGMTGYVLACTGLKNCVDRLKKDKAEMKKEIAVVEGEKQRIANDANTKIQSGIQNVTGQMKIAQSAIESALADMMATAGQLGATDLPDMPEKTKGKDPSEWGRSKGVGGENDLGPYTNPGDLKEIAGGLFVDGEPSKTIKGIDGAIAQAKKEGKDDLKTQKKDLKDELKTAEDYLAKLRRWKNKKTCDGKVDPNSSPNETCKINIKECGKTQLGTLLSSLNDYVDKYDDSDSDSDSDNIKIKDESRINDLLEALNGSECGSTKIEVEDIGACRASKKDENVKYLKEAVKGVGSGN